MSAITTATIVGIAAAGASAGATVYAAKKGASAAKDAAAQQTSAADKALAAQKESYATQRQDFDPFRQAAGGAVNRLQQQSAQPRMTFVPGQQATLGNPMGAQMPQNPGQGGSGPTMQPQPMPGKAQGPMLPQGQPQGQMVLMQGPDGSKRPVPAHVVPQLQQRGFQVIQ